MTPIAQNRDIIFDFRDSCNCCAWRKPNPGQRMYVHTNGDVTPFSTRKSRAESAAERTFAHVIQLVQRVTSQHRISTTTSEQLVCDTGLTS